MQFHPRQKDVEEVRQAVLDYIEGTYQVDPSRTKRSVHPDLAKLGFVQEGGTYKGYRMTFASLVEAAGTFNQDGCIAPDAPKAITVFEVLDQTASVKLEAWWGIDYLHLAKYDGKWMIINVLWQTYPTTEVEDNGASH
jgi:hypothetical protein